MPAGRVHLSPVGSLELEPVARPLTRPIRRVDTLGDDPFDVMFGARGEHIDDGAVEPRSRTPACRRAGPSPSRGVCRLTEGSLIPGRCTASMSNATNVNGTC